MQGSVGLWGWRVDSNTHNTPDVLRFRQSLVQVIQELASRVQVYQIDQRVGRARVVRADDDVVLGARGQATQPPPLCKTRDPDTTRLATKEESRDSPDMRHRGGLPPGSGLVHLLTATHSRAIGAALSAALLSMMSDTLI